MPARRPKCKAVLPNPRRGKLWHAMRGLQIADGAEAPTAYPTCASTEKVVGKVAAKKKSKRKPKRKKESKPSNEITWANNIEPTEVQWTVPGYIPHGQVTFLGGDPDCGKSLVSLAIAAIESTGSPWPVPNGGNGSGGKVLILASEDDPATTIVPRLEMLGADLGKIGILTPKRRITLKSSRWLRSRIREAGATLLIIDPIESFIPRGKSISNTTVMREALDGLAKLARQENIAILVIRHLIKGKARKTIHAGKGSGSQTAAVRSELRAGVTAWGARALVHVKCNIAAKSSSIGYKIDSDGTFRWTGVCSVTADDIDNPAPRTDAAVVAFLRAYLPCPVKELKKRAKKAGMMWGAVERVAGVLGVEKTPLPRKGGGRGRGPSVWRIPKGPVAPVSKKSKKSARHSKLNR